MIIKYARQILGEIHEVRKGVWACFLDCAFRMLIGWGGKLRSRALGEKETLCLLTFLEWKFAYLF